MRFVQSATVLCTSLFRIYLFILFELWLDHFFNVILIQWPHSLVELLLYAYKYIKVWKTTAVCCKLSLAHVVGPEIEAYLILPILPKLRLPSQLRRPLRHIFSTSQPMQLSYETENRISTSLRSFFRYPSVTQQKQETANALLSSWSRFLGRSLAEAFLLEWQSEIAQKY